MDRNIRKERFTGTAHHHPFYLGFLLIFLFTVLAPAVSMAATPQVSAGYAHSVALKSDGTVWTWGDNSSSQLGYVTSQSQSQSPLPQQVTAVSGIIGIAAGEDHTLALNSSGNVWAWGGNDDSQLGNPTITSDPNQISGLSNITAIAAGTQFSMALDSSGNVWAWGRNDFGQIGTGYLGDGTTNVTGSVLTPTKITTLSEIKWIAAGDCHAIASNGSTVWAWGCNSNGQLGTGATVTASPTAQTSSPVEVTSLSGVTVTGVAAGGSNNADYYGGQSLAIMSGGTVEAWGSNIAGQLGDGNNTDSSTPGPVSSLTSVTGISAGFSHSIALDKNGALWAWGDNSSGEFGNNTTAGSNVPVTTFSSATPADACSAGYFFTLVIKADGTVWASGSNDTGQLGNGVVDQFPSTNSTPAKVLDLSLSILGDMNSDGKVSAVDALLALQYAVGINTLNLTSFDAIARGDLGGFGKINAADALLILKKAVGL